MIRRVFPLVVVCVCLFAAPARAETINALVEGAAAFDGQTVTVTGEVIGDVMPRGEGGWINVSDGTNDIGVWTTAESLRQIKFAGRYHQTGDQVQVIGQFRRADTEFGGDLLIRAASVEVLAHGGPVGHPLQGDRPRIALLALLAATALGLLRWRARVAAR